MYKLSFHSLPSSFFYLFYTGGISQFCILTLEGFQWLANVLRQSKLAWSAFLPTHHASILGLGHTQGSFQTSLQSLSQYLMTVFFLHLIRVFSFGCSLYFLIWPLWLQTSCLFGHVLSSRVFICPCAIRLLPQRPAYSSSPLFEPLLYIRRVCLISFNPFSKLIRDVQ